MPIVRLDRKRNLVLSIIFSCFILLAFHFYFPRSLNPALGFDTVRFYYPTQGILNSAHLSFVKLFVAPFFTNNSLKEVDAKDVKPVFVIALRLWGLLHRAIFNPAQTFPNRHEYADFIVFSCGILFFMICLIGCRFGYPFLGILTGYITLLSPWGMEVCYFYTYTAFSMSLYLLAFLVVLQNTFLSLMAAGVISSLVLLSNQSAIVFIIGLMALGMYLQSSRQKTVFACFAFLSGFSLIFLLCELLKNSKSITALMGTGNIHSPLENLIGYYYHSNTDCAEFFDAYKGDLMLTIVRHNSVVILFAFLVAPFILYYIARAKKTNEACKILLKKISMLLLPSIIGIALIDFRYRAVKFSRAYFIAYPLLVLSILILFVFLSKSHKTVFYIAVGALVFYIGETAYNLNDQYIAFFGLRQYINSTLKPGEQVAVLDIAAYNEFFKYLFEGGGESRSSMRPKVICIDDAFRMPHSGRDIVYLITGPSECAYIKSSLPDAHCTRIVVIGERKEEMIFFLEKQFPFFWTYPLFILEDPELTYQYIVTNKLHRYDYRNDKGTVKVWRRQRIDSF